MESGGKKDMPQSPTQYYLSELGLNLEWQNNLLQFGPAVSLSTRPSRTRTLMMTC